VKAKGYGVFRMVNGTVYEGKDARNGQMGLDTGENFRIEINGVMGLYSLQMEANIQGACSGKIHSKGIYIG
jgi:hypothetical protein